MLSTKIVLAVALATTSVTTEVVPYPKHISVIPVSLTTTSELSCLAKNIYHEARGESSKGQLAVVAVTLNRVNSQKYPSTICGVVKQKCQFSWVCDPRTKMVQPAVMVKYKQLAFDYLIQYHGGVDPTNGAMFYHAYYVKPHWSRNKKPTAVIGAHSFYKVI